MRTHKFFDECTKDELQAEWDRAGRCETWGRVIWIALLVSLLLLIASNAFAGTYYSAEDTLQEASGLEDWRQQLLTFEQSLTAQQKEMFQTLSNAQKRELMLKNDVRAQQGNVDLYRQNAQSAAYETHQQKRINAQLMQQLDAQRPQLTPQSEQTPQKAYGYADKNAPQQTAQVLTDTQTSQEWVVDRGVFRPVETTKNTYIVQPSPIYVQPGKASMRHRITGNDFDSSLIIPEGTDANTLQTLENATVNATERYKQKLSMLHEGNVMQFNTDLYKATTARQTALGWLTLPLIVVCSLCGMYIYKTVTHDRRERLKVELGVIDKERR